MSVDLVCIDVDGTLVGASGDVLPAVWSAVARAQRAGLILALCSGRPAFGVTRGFAERLNADGWHVFQNGASVMRLGDQASKSAAIPADVVAGLVARARAVGRLLELYSDESYAFEIASDLSRQHAKLLGVPFVIRSFESLDGVVVRAQWVVPKDEAADVLREPHVGLELGPATSPTMPDSVFINMTAHGVNKAEGVRAVAAAYGIPLARVMFVGDGENDVGAMSIVGLPVAMANADESVRRIAVREVAPVDEAGLADALDWAATLRDTSK